MAPGHVLTSMLKRVDVAAYETMKDGFDGNFSAGVKILGAIVPIGGVLLIVGWVLLAISAARRRFSERSSAVNPRSAL